MKYTRLGGTGMQVSRLCLGCMSFGQSFADWAIRTLGLRREELVIATKVFAPIIGANKLQQLDDPLRAVDTVLSDEEVARLEAPYVTQMPIGLADPRSAGSMLGNLRFGLPQP